MARIHLASILFVVFAFCVTCRLVRSADQEEPKVRIVYMGALPTVKQTAAARYEKILQEVGVSQQAMVRKYTRSFAGFAAHITDKQQQALAAHDEVIAVFPSQTVQLLTTKSWDFMGFPINVSRDRAAESDVIIGLLDTGVWPESDSFNLRGLSPPPLKWKGVCEGGKNFTCNNKIIGARSYTNDGSSRDTVGHGTHTASTAAGIEVQNTSFYGIAEGIARGGVPSARIAVYKVCGANGCSDRNILAAFDDAIADGVDILSLSLGSLFPRPFATDAISIGSLHAMTKGILTVNAAGNSGDSAGTTTSVAPWLFSVAASMTSRQIINKVQLGNGKEQLGHTINTFSLNNTKFPLVYGKDASSLNCSGDSIKSCGCLEREKVKGKIVLCTNIAGVAQASKAGAIGSISNSNHFYDASRITPIPASNLRSQDFELLESYYNSTKNPEGTISSSEIIENKNAPVIASFSSRGPNTNIPDILKPDIAAPGVDILAAFLPVVSPSGDASDKRSVPYNILGGTSMACPHVAGAAAYVKSKHPDWSPSAVKSAIMTTALPMNASQGTGGGKKEFAYGAGFLDPVKAVNPGLVYETSKMDYVKMLCGLGFNNAALRKIFGDNTTCPKEKSTPRELNYPTMAAKCEKLQDVSVKFPRTVTNVGKANSTYKATVSQIPGLNITVEPNFLSFKELNEKQSFVVTVSGKSSENMVSASLEWSDGSNVVRSPIVVYKKS